MIGGILSPEDEQRIAAGVAKLRELVEAGDPEILEDLASLSESAPFVTRIRESRGFMKCERCRVPVIAVPEALAEVEPELRKRCEAMREKAAR